MCLISTCPDAKCTNVDNFHPLDVVCRGSDTQLQAGENLDII